MISALLFWMSVSGCVRTVPVSPVVTVPLESAKVLERARAISLPDSGQIRLQFKGSSKVLNFSGSVGGVLLFDRPDGAKLELIAPFIGPIFSAVYDGSALSVLMYSNAEQLYSDDPDHWISEVTQGVLKTDEFFGLMIGDLPMDDSMPLSVEVGPTRSVVATWKIAEGHKMTATIGEAGFLQGVIVSAPDATLVFSIVYGEYVQSNEVWLPKAITLEIPRLTLNATVTFRGVISELSKPITWDTSTPRGFVRKDVPVEN
jgi:hypothetical protein